MNETVNVLYYISTCMVHVWYLYGTCMVHVWYIYVQLCTHVSIVTCEAKLVMHHSGICILLQMYHLVAGVDVIELVILYTTNMADVDSSKST